MAAIETYIFLKLKRLQESSLDVFFEVIIPMSTVKEEVNKRKIQRSSNITVLTSASYKDN